MKTIGSLRPPVAVAGKSRFRSTTWASIILAAIPFVTAPALGQTDAPAGLLGRWITHTGNLEVQIAPCGAAVCGTVTKVLGNRSMSGSGEMAAADTRSPLGMTILKDFTSSGDGEWSGELYDRENAKTYSCKIALGGPDQLVVKPYIGLPIFSKTLVWKRATTQTGQK